MQMKCFVRFFIKGTWKGANLGTKEDKVTTWHKSKAYNGDGVWQESMDRNGSWLERKLLWVHESLLPFRVRTIIANSALEKFEPEGL